MRTEDYDIFKVPEQSYTTSFFIGNGKKKYTARICFLEYKLPVESKQSRQNKDHFLP